MLRKVDKAVEFSKLYEIVEPLYSENEGRPCIDSVVLFKIVLLQHLDGLLFLIVSFTILIIYDINSITLYSIS